MRHLVHTRNRSGAYSVLMEKPEGKRPLGRSGLRGEGNIKTDRHELVWGSVDWIDVAQDMDKWRAHEKAL